VTAAIAPETYLNFSNIPWINPDVCKHLCSDLLPEVEQSVCDIGMCDHYLEIAIHRGDIWRNLNYALSENIL
jgi:hypothetical protein